MSFTQGNLLVKEGLYQSQVVKKLVTNQIESWISYFKMTKENKLHIAQRKGTLKIQEGKLLTIIIIIGKQENKFDMELKIIFIHSKIDKPIKHKIAKDSFKS